MEEIFLKSLKINKVRHLEGIDISISETERKHLILTGKNGSGKTSILELLKEYFASIEKDAIHIEDWKFDIKKWEKAIKDNTVEAKNLPSYQNAILANEERIALFSKIEPAIELFNAIGVENRRGKFMFAHFPAKRGGQIYEPTYGPQKLNLDDHDNSINQKYSHLFIQYLVNLKTERSFARDENDEISADSIDKWFEDFEDVLKQIYGEEVKLEFDRKEWNFYLLIDGYERFDLNHLSDGYSAIMEIISELLLRMEKFNNLSHNMQGIVLIDEIETHLHIELQKKVLPFLTTFFPKLQFIITTHSPFVLSSVNNAVIFDLEKRESVEDLSGYSVENIIESYFDADQYSELLNKRVEEYDVLSNNAEHSAAEEARLKELETYFQKFPLNIAPELSLKLNTIRLKKIA